MAKIAEQRLVAFIRYLGWYSHKYGDVRYCIHCNKPLPKTENAPDYAIGMPYTWVECKNSNKTGLYNWKSDIGPEGSRQNQRRWLQEHGGWLYIVLKDGRAPAEESGFLIPWMRWVNDIEPQLEHHNMASFRRETVNSRPGADVLMKEYALEWVEGTWHPPAGHYFWTAYHTALLKQANFIAENYLHHREGVHE